MRALFRWALVFAWAAFIFYMSSRTSTDLDTGMLGQVKLAVNQMIAGITGSEGDYVSSISHFAEYLVLGLLLANALRSHVSIGLAAIMCICLASAYGVTDEFHQLFVEGRFCDPKDWGVDTAGAALGALVAWLGLRRAVG